MDRFYVLAFLLILPLYGMSRAAQEIVKTLEPYQKKPVLTKVEVASTKIERTQYFELNKEGSL